MVTYIYRNVCIYILLIIADIHMADSFNLLTIRVHILQ
jgi:hypothetical protein